MSPPPSSVLVPKAWSGALKTGWGFGSVRPSACELRAVGAAGVEEGGPAPGRPLRLEGPGVAQDLRQLAPKWLLSSHHSGDDGVEGVERGVAFHLRADFLVEI